MITSGVNAQNYWQQAVKYDMEIDMDEAKNQFKGKQKVVYTNNSPETLDKVYYHLYFNAFQPGSMMDVRSRNIVDPDRRINDRILYLKEDEIGYHKIKSLKQDGKKVKFEVVGTILEVELKKPIKPNSSSTLEMTFESQIPKQIRRSGRDNAEGVRFSMTQWYPKLCAYDQLGWHANPYIAREYHGVWGDFDVTIDIDNSYILGGTGLVQSKKHSSKNKQKWHFKAERVHDFAWAADPEYLHFSHEAYDGTIFNFYHQSDEEINHNWAKLPEIMDEVLKYVNELCGEYPYPQYSIIQGGDGGMEYPMATLITGGRDFPGLVSVSVHEFLHSWYQGLLGTNESLYYWMDEGFTSYYQDKTLNHLKDVGLLPGTPVENPHLTDQESYKNFTKTGHEEAMSNHADHFDVNRAYSIAAYTKGAVFLDQLQYVVGDEAFRTGMLEYYNTWKYKHPTPNDFIRIMELESELELDWYKEYFVQGTKTIDYGIYNVEKSSKKVTSITLVKKGKMPMPIDLVVTKKNGKKETYYIPLSIMRGEKKFKKADKMKLAEDWPWTHPGYFMEIECPLDDILTIEIDPSMRMADVNRSNNVWTISIDGTQ
jgi:hypothetical protein